MDYKNEFINFMLESEVLKFGDFVLKSGRKSPIFMNLGSFTDGDQLLKLGEFYAKAIYESFGDDIDVFYGPAYKGIPLSVAVSIAFFRLYGKKVHYTSNRKEIKDHGDSGILLGHTLKPKEKVIIVEDVTTSGKSIDENMPILKEFDVNIIGLVVSLNRQEKGKNDDISALDEVAKKYNIKTKAIVTMQEVLNNLRKNNALNDEMFRKIEKYYEEFGAKSK